MNEKTSKSRLTNFINTEFRKEPKDIKTTTLTTTTTTGTRQDDPDLGYQYSCTMVRHLSPAVPDLGLWRPLGNTRKDFYTKGHVRHNYASTHNVTECSCDTNSNNILSLNSLQTRHLSTFALSKVSDEIVKACLA